MNKISKKIVALATMAAFVLTLVPAAAFAAPADKTGYTVTKAEATTDKYNSTTVNITLSDEDLDAVLADAANNVLVWAEDANDTVVGNYGTVTDATWGGSYNASNTFNGMAVLVPNADDNTFSIDIDDVGAVGDYKVYVALNVAPHAQSVADAENAAIVKGGVTFHALGDAVGDASNYGVYEGGVLQAEEDVAVNTDLTTTFKINDKNGDATAPDLEDVVVWAVNKDNGQVTELASIVDEDGNPVRKTGSTGNNAKSYYLDSVNNGETLTVQFSIAGDYVLYAGVGTSYDAANAAKLGLGRAVTTVHVTDNTEVDYFTVEAEAFNHGNGTAIASQELVFDETNTAVLNFTEGDFADFRFNGADSIRFSGVAYEKDNTPAKGQTIDFTTDRNDVVEFVGVTGNTDTDNTDTDGRFDTEITMQSAQNAYLTITDKATGLKYDVRIIANVATPASIDRTLTGGNILAGTDDHWNTADHAWFTDAVQFQIIDTKNEVVTGGLDSSDYIIDVRTVPGNSAVVADRLEDRLELRDSGNGVYTLVYTGTDAQAAEDLKEGKYEVRVALAGANDKDDNATVTFNAMEYGTTKDTVLDITAHDRSSGRIVRDIDDEITLGQDVTVVGKYVDENGLKINATGLVIGATGDAVKDLNAQGYTFTTKDDVAANESLLGTTITVWAQNSANKQLVSRELTVVKSYNAFTLEFDKAEGAVGEDNDVTVNVVKEDGSRAQVTGTLYAFIADQSNKDAKVSLDGDNTDVTNGRGHLSIYASEETTVDVVVGVKDANNDGFYAATLEYTVGAEDPLSDYTVVMTIDSSEYVVNNNVIKGDAAPYVDSAWRTMVPIRALMEAFDAEVVWDEANPDVVTINYDGDTQIVMNVGDEAYTIDGEEGEMDTVPVNNNGRVYVPIRFVAEGIGFHVTPLYNADGLTASVVFQR